MLQQGKDGPACGEGSGSDVPPSHRAALDDKNDRFALLGTARRSEDLFVALAESKATKGASRAAFTKTIRDGYKEQVEPYLCRKIGSWVASHGYAVGS
ncbi:hypothetical protein GGI64_005820 [Rhizobium leguminosarum]|uniref:Uncharacterized protein n=1 Tax=Rhizobium leguminosarum TaxID=384 RepID=A0A7Z0J161_RHILE|nr:hypothetical protein [Rhizobium leguminosarum]NYJ14722.1 hypothetical protein [Rhizobium leguminosarum]